MITQELLESALERFDDEENTPQEAEEWSALEQIDLKGLEKTMINYWRKFPALDTLSSRAGLMALMALGVRMGIDAARNELEKQ